MSLFKYAQVLSNIWKAGWNTGHEVHLDFTVSLVAVLPHHSYRNFSKAFKHVFILTVSICIPPSYYWTNFILVSAFCSTEVAHVGVMNYLLLLSQFIFLSASHPTNVAHVGVINYLHVTNFERHFKPSPYLISWQFLTTSSLWHFPISCHTVFSWTCLAPSQTHLLGYVHPNHDLLDGVFGVLPEFPSVLIQRSLFRGST